MATDDFNRTETPLASPWAAVTGRAAMNANGSSAIGSNVANMAIHTTAASTVDHYSEITCGSGQIGAMVRSLTAGSQAYYVDFSVGNVTRQWTLYKYNGGWPEQATGTFPSTTQVGDVIRLEVTGTSPAVLVIKQNGNTITDIVSGTLSDSITPFTTGQPGIECGLSTDTIDAWAGGDLGAAQSQAPRSMHQFAMRRH